MVRCCLQLDAPRRFPAYLAEVDLTAAALARLAKTRLLSKVLVHRKCRLLPGVWVLVVSMREARVLRDIAACGQVGSVVTLTAYHFMISILEHVTRYFAAFHSFIFLF